MLDEAERAELIAAKADITAKLRWLESPARSRNPRLIAHLRGMLQEVVALLEEREEKS